MFKSKKLISSAGVVKVISLSSYFKKPEKLDIAFIQDLLVHAIVNEDIIEIKRLVKEEHADLNYSNAVTPPPLVHAIYTESSKSVEALLELGADVDRKWGKEGQEIPIMAIPFSNLDDSISSQQLDILWMVFNKSENDEFTLLLFQRLQQLFFDNDDVKEKILSKLGELTLIKENLNEIVADLIGYSLREDNDRLFEYIYNNYNNIFNELDIEEKDRIVFCAVENGKLDLFDEYNYFDFNILKYTFSNGANMFHVAAGLNDLTLLKELYEQDSSFMRSEDDFGNSAFVSASINSNVSVMYWLYEKDGDWFFSHKNKYGMDVFLSSVYSESTQKKPEFIDNLVFLNKKKSAISSLKWLYQKRPEFVESKDSNGFNAMFHSVFAENQEAILWLEQIKPGMKDSPESCSFDVLKKDYLSDMFFYWLTSFSSANTMKITPAMWANFFAKHKSISTLIDLNTDFTVEDQLKRTMLEYFFINTEMSLKPAELNELFELCIESNSFSGIQLLNACFLAIERKEKSIVTLILAKLKQEVIYKKIYSDIDAFQISAFNKIDKNDDSLYLSLKKELFNKIKQAIQREDFFDNVLW